tara:strand:- start:773 stop:1087 length:315 start_codon:yes stop_codon:yes gene_type:complete
MKISITTNNKVFTAEDDFGFDCASIQEAVEMFKGLLVCAGFHPSNVDDAFNIEYTWFTEEEKQELMQGHIKCPKLDEVLEKKGFKDVEEWQNNLYKQDADDIFS